MVNKALKVRIYPNKTQQKKIDELYIGKCFVDQYGNDEMFNTKIDVKIKKSKPKTVPKGAVVRKIHVYYFYGWAAE